MCRGDWKTHGQHTGGFYSCNKYDSSDAKKVDDEASRAKAESDRFLHYFTRFFNHDVLNKVRNMKGKRRKGMEDRKDKGAMGEIKKWMGGDRSPINFLCSFSFIFLF